MKLIAALLAFCLVGGVSAPASAASRMLSQSPDFNVTPLTKADIDTYIAIRRAALQRLRSATGDDREALDWVKLINRDAPLPGERQIDVLNPSPEILYADRQLSVLSNLQHIDKMIARERGIEDRYRAIEWAIRNRLGLPNGYNESKPFCGRGGDCGPSPTPLQVTLMNREKAVRSVDLPLVEARRAEIEAIYRQFSELVYPR